MLDKNVFDIKDIQGLNFGSGDNEISYGANEFIPFEHNLSLTNFRTLKEGGTRTRDGFTTVTGVSLSDFGIPNSGVGTFSQHWKISNIAGAVQTNRWLVLFYTNTGVGDFYDSGAADPTTPILSITGCKYASVINIFGRLYISPLSDFGTPLTSEFVYLYDGTNAARKAAGSAPSMGTMAVVNGTVAGANVTVGQHLFTVVFETDSGFITPTPAPANWLSLVVTAAANRCVAVSNIPTGGTEVVARHILMTKVILNYDNIPENWEMFFALTINDNVTTTGNIVLPDTGLVDSADYLLNTLDELPACNSISVYSGRLMYNGPDGNPDLVYVTKVADPESVDQTEDYIQIKDGIPIDILNGRELRGVYYIFKENCTFATQDSSDSPNAWKVEIIDSGIGCVPFGLADVLANPGGLIYDNLLVASLTGIHIFSGTYSQSLLSHKIQALWSRLLTKSTIKYVRMVADPIQKSLYLLIGQPWTPLARLYVGDYYNGLDPQSIKWGQWNFSVLITPTEGHPYIETSIINNILVDPADDLTNFPRLTVLCGNELLDGVLRAIDKDSIIDADDQAINWELQTGFTQGESGYLYKASYLRLRVAGQNADYSNITLSARLVRFDDGTESTTQSLDIEVTPNKYYTVPIPSFIAEHMGIRINGTGSIYLSRLMIFIQEIIKDLPR